MGPRRDPHTSCTTSRDGSARAPGAPSAADPAHQFFCTRSSCWTSTPMREVAASGKFHAPSRRFVPPEMISRALDWPEGCLWHTSAGALAARSMQHRRRADETRQEDSCRACLELRGRSGRERIRRLDTYQHYRQCGAPIRAVRRSHAAQRLGLRLTAYKSWSSWGVRMSRSDQFGPSSASVTR